MGHEHSQASFFKDYPKEIILKDGTGVTIRPLRQGDGGALQRMFQTFPEEDLWFLNHDLSNPRLIEGWINDLDVSRVISLVALLEGQVIANAALMRKSYGAKSHIGKVRISVAPAYRGKRLGTWMLLDLVNLGMDIGLKMLVMRLFPERDTSIIRGAERIEFVREATLKDYAIDRSGNPHDLLILVKRLPEAWVTLSELESALIQKKSHGMNDMDAIP